MGEAKVNTNDNAAVKAINNTNSGSERNQNASPKGISLCSSHELEVACDENHPSKRRKTKNSQDEPHTLCNKKDQGHSQNLEICAQPADLASHDNAQATKTCNDELSLQLNTISNVSVLSSMLENDPVKNPKCADDCHGPISTDERKIHPGQDTMENIINPTVRQVGIQVKNTPVMMVNLLRICGYQFRVKTLSQQWAARS